MTTPSRPHSRTRHILANAIATVVSLAIAVVGLELALRLYFYGDLRRPNYSVQFSEPHPTRGWANRPGARGVHQELDFRVDVTVSPKATRGKDFDAQPDGRRQRIMLVGDSALFGSGVSDQDCLAAQLQAVLGPGVEIINLSALAYSTVQELLWLRETGLGWKPDLVVLAFAASNDIQTNVVDLQRLYQRTLRRPYASLGSGGKLQIDTSAASEGERRAGARAERNFFNDLVLTRIGKIVVHKFTDSETVDPNIFLGWSMLTDFLPQYATGGRRVADYSRLWQNGWQVTEALIEAMATESRAAGATFAMFVPPVKMQADPALRQRIEQAYPGARLDPLKMDRELQALAGRLGVTALDITTTMMTEAARGGAPLYYDIEDEHWTPRGNRVAAEALARELRRAGLVK